MKFGEADSLITMINITTNEQALEYLNQILQENKDMFEDEIGCVTHYQHKIIMSKNTPHKKKTYPIPEKHISKVRKCIQELKEQGLKKAATQHINSLVVIIKKNRDIHLCLDIREINKKMNNNHAQPPTIEEIFHRVGKKKIIRLT